MRLEVYGAFFYFNRQVSLKVPLNRKESPNNIFGCASFHPCCLTVFADRVPCDRQTQKHIFPHPCHPPSARTSSKSTVFGSFVTIPVQIFQSNQRPPYKDRSGCHPVVAAVAMSVLKIARHPKGHPKDGVRKYLASSREHRRSAAHPLERPDLGCCGQRLRRRNLHQRRALH